MISVTLSYGKNGVLKKCEANGHACFSKKGTDIVCSAVTILLRTAAELLSHTENVAFEADFASRGNLAFRVEVKEESPELESRLRCISDFIRVGIDSVSKEYPENVHLREEIENI